MDPYRLFLQPGVLQRRPEWDLLFESEIPVVVDFIHTQMMEKVIIIRRAKIKGEGEKEDNVD